MRFHPPAEELSAFLGALGTTHAALLDHLLACDRCSAIAQERLERPAAVLEPEDPVNPSWYEDALREVKERVRALAADRDERIRQALPLFQSLMESPSVTRIDLIHSDARFHSWELAELLLHELRTGGDREPLARLLLALAEKLPDTEARSSSELRVVAHVELGDWFRSRQFIQAAEMEFMRATGFLDEVEEQAERARYCHLLGKLRHQQKRSDEAQALLQRAADLFGRCGRYTARAGALIDCGLIALDGADPQQALEVFDEAFAAGVGYLTPAMGCRTVAGMAVALAMDGSIEKAISRIAEGREIFRWEDDSLESLSLLDLEARLALGSKQFDLARGLLERAFDGFVNRNEALRAASSAVLLATIARGQRLRDELKKVTKRLWPLLKLLPEPARQEVQEFVMEGGRLDRNRLRWLCQSLEDLRKRQIEHETSEPPAAGEVQ